MGRIARLTFGRCASGAYPPQVTLVSSGCGICSVIMGCCFGKRDDELPPAFDPTIGLCEKLKGPGLTVTGLQVSGVGSILGDSPVLQDKGYFEVRTTRAGTLARRARPTRPAAPSQPPETCGRSAPPLGVSLRHRTHTHAQVPPERTHGAACT